MSYGMESINSNRLYDMNYLRIGVYKIIYVDDGDRDEKSIEDFRKLALRSIFLSTNENVNQDDNIHML